MKALVGIIMGSSSDWETMSAAAEMLTKLAISHETRVVSAHRSGEGVRGSLDGQANQPGPAESRRRQNQEGGG